MRPGGYPDSLGVWDEVAALPEQLTAAWEVAGRAFGAATIPGKDTVRAVAVFGAGTGATAGDAVRAFARPSLSVPMWVGTPQGGEVPAFVDRYSLCFAVSASEADADVAAAAAAALGRGATVLAVGGVPGGALAQVVADARLASCPIVSLDPTRPRRTALAGATIPLLVGLGAAGLLPDCAPSVTRAASALDRQRDALLASGGPAEVLARRLGRTIPILYGGTDVAAVGAQWWKTCINLHAKAPAFSSTLGAATTVELAGWGQAGDITRQVMTLVLLRDTGEDEEIVRAFDSVREATDEVMADVMDVRAEGDDDLCRFFHLALFGEVVSLHLAGREGVDPGPVPAVDAVHAAAPPG